MAAIQSERGENSAFQANEFQEGVTVKFESKKSSKKSKNGMGVTVEDLVRMEQRERK